MKVLLSESGFYARGPKNVVRFIVWKLWKAEGMLLLLQVCAV